LTKRKFKVYTHNNRWYLMTIRNFMKRGFGNENKESYENFNGHV